jgi:excisionase family DNA binding protein
MSSSLELFHEKAAPNHRGLATEGHGHRPLLSPPNAWRILHRRTGGHVSRSTFYRWLESGKVYSLRMGSRMYIPWQALQEIIQKCLHGEPF